MLYGNVQQPGVSEHGMLSCVGWIAICIVRSNQEHIHLQVLKSGLHIALKSEDYVSAVRQSILAGGDSTSR